MAELTPRRSQVCALCGRTPSTRYIDYGGRRFCSGQGEADCFGMWWTYKDQLEPNAPKLPLVVARTKRERTVPPGLDPEYRRRRELLDARQREAEGQWSPGRNKLSRPFGKVSKEYKRAKPRSRGGNHR